MLTRLAAAAATAAAALALVTVGAGIAIAGGCGLDYCESDVTIPGTPGTTPDGPGQGGGGGDGNAGGASTGGGAGAEHELAFWEKCLADQAATGVVCAVPKPGDPATPGAPGAPAAPPDPAIVAQMAKARLKLAPPAIGSAPCTTNGCMGAVGVPVWLWVDGGFPTQSASASVAGVNVTITATMTQVNWSMGDGTVLNCGAGTPYNASIGWAKSPDCGYLYTRKGQYPITATATWDATFTGDYTGTDIATSQDTVNATIGEYQAIVTG